MSLPTVPIGEFCETGSGSTPSRGVASYFGGSVPWVKSGELRDGVVTRTEEHVTPDGIAAARLKTVPAGALLVAMYGATVGRTALLGIDATTNQAVCHVRPDPARADTKYLWFALQAKLPELLARRVGGAQPNISQETIRSTSVYLPPLPEQRRIADILDKADAVRRKRKEAIALTEELLRSAFLEMFGDPVANPRGWATQPLESLIDNERGISYGVVQRGQEVEDGVPVVRISNFADNRFDGTSVVRTAKEVSDSFRRTVLRGRELVVSIRGTVGRVATVPVSAHGWNVSREVAVIPLLEDVSRAFVHRALLTEGAQRFMLGNVKGVAQSGINLADLRQTPIPMPPPREIARFERAVDLLGRTENSARRGTTEAERLFDSLVHHAFRGEVVAAPAASESAHQLGGQADARA